MQNNQKISKKIIVAIDGPSASGKGTLAKKIAEYFDLSYLNTGAIYRAVAFKIMHNKNYEKLIEGNINSQSSAFSKNDDFLTKNIFLELSQNLTEQDLANDNLFSEEVGQVASIIAKNHDLREVLFDFQKNFIAAGKKNKNGCVLDGRDTTSVICPDADFKFFITADVEIRARRRFEQLKNQDYSQILEQLKKRDHNDFNRQIAPLKIVADAVIIDNGKLNIQESFDVVLKIINSKINPQ